MSTELSHTDRYKVGHVIPLPANAYHGMFAEQRYVGTSKVTTIGSMPVVALVVLEYAEGAIFDAICADWEEGFTLLGSLSNARGVCTAEELEEAKANAGGGKVSYVLSESSQQPKADPNLGYELIEFLKQRGY